jgi:hypothetical protein
MDTKAAAAEQQQPHPQQIEPVRAQQAKLSLRV